MCGFVVELCGAGGPSRDVSDIIDFCLPLLERRGPDDYGYVDMPGRFFAVNARLAIQDLSANASLPFQTWDGRSCLAYNGELYNAAALRVRCEERGWAFRTLGDTEVVLASLRCFGPPILSEFNGMFAFAYYDRETGLILARDHAGIKPLFYAGDGQGRMQASSSFEALARLIGPRRLTEDATALAHYLRLGHVPAPATLFKEIRSLEPGMALVVDPTGRVAQHRFFDFGDLRQQPRAAEEIVEELDGLLQSAVKRQMVGDVEIGALMSGGIDSPLVAALARTQNAQPLKIYCCAMAGAAVHFSEELDARRFAQALDLDARFVCMNDATANTLLDEVILSIREPMADEGMFPALLVSERASHDVKVVMSGDGADELFMGYIPRQSPMRAHASIDSPGQWAERYGRAFNDFPEHWFRKCFPQTPFDPGLEQLVGEPSAEAGVDQWMRRVEYQTYLPFILAKTDRASMHHGLEVRVPFLDLEVVRFAASVDPALFYEGNTGKVPLRHLLARRAGFQTKGKRPFTSPMDAWLRGPLRAQAQLSVSRLAGFGSCETRQDAMEQMLQAHLSGQVELGMALWRVVVLDHWMTRLAQPHVPARRPTAHRRHELNQMAVE